MSHCLRAFGVIGMNFKQNVKWEVGHEGSTSTVRSADWTQTGLSTLGFSVILQVSLTVYARQSIKCKLLVRHS